MGQQSLPCHHLSPLRCSSQHLVRSQHAAMRHCLGRCLFVFPRGSNSKGRPRQLSLASGRAIWKGGARCSLHNVHLRSTPKQLLIWWPFSTKRMCVLELCFDVKKRPHHREYSWLAARLQLQCCSQQRLRFACWPLTTCCILPCLVFFPRCSSKNQTASKNPQTNNLSNNCVFTFPVRSRLTHKKELTTPEANSSFTQKDTNKYEPIVVISIGEHNSCGKPCSFHHRPHGLESPWRSMKPPSPSSAINFGTHSQPLWVPPTIQPALTMI